MAAISKTLTLLMSLAAALPAAAQDTAAPADQAPAANAAPAADAATPADAQAAPDGIGQPYTAETFDDWELRCVRTADGADPCQIYQLLRDKNGNPVSEISMISLQNGGKVSVGANIITPLETLLTEQLAFAVDDGKPQAYPFSFCTPVGCYARLGFTEEEVGKMKKGNKAAVTIVPVGNPNAKVTLDVSLKGFTAALEAQKKAEDALATKAGGAAEAPAEAPAQ